MNPLLQDAIGSILRFFLAGAATWLVQHGIWSSTAAETYVGAASLALVSLGWSLVNKYKSRLKLLTALTMPVGTTEQDVTDHIAAGGAVPLLSTPVTTAPVPQEIP